MRIVAFDVETNDTLNAMKCYLHLFSHNPAATVAK